MPHLICLIQPFCDDTLVFCCFHQTKSSQPPQKDWSSQQSKKATNWSMFWPSQLAVWNFVHKSSWEVSPHWDCESPGWIRFIGEGGPVVMVLVKVILKLKWWDQLAILAILAIFTPFCWMLFLGGFKEAATYIFFSSPTLYDDWLKEGHNVRVVDAGKPPSRDVASSCFLGH